MTNGLNRNYESNNKQDEHPLTRATRKAKEAATLEDAEATTEAQEQKEPVKPKVVRR